MAHRTKKPIPQPRNAVVMVARTRNAGYLRDRRSRRVKDRLAREIRDTEGTYLRTSV